MKTHTLSTRVLAMLLTLVMVLGMVPVSALAAPAVDAPVFRSPAEGNVAAGTGVKFTKAGVWYSIRTSGPAPTAQEIFAEGNKAPAWYLPSPVIITEDCTVYAVNEKNGAFSDVVSASYRVMPTVNFGMQMGTEIQSMGSASKAINVSKYFVKISALNNATEYYYLASTAEQKNITAEQVAAGVKVNADTFDEIKSGSEVIRLGNEGGVIYIYAAAKKADGSYSPVTTIQYQVDALSLAAINMTPSTTGPVLAGEKVTLAFDTLPAEYDQFNPVYTYTLNGADPKTVVPEAGKATGEVTLSAAGDNVIKFTVTSAALGETYTQSKEVTIKTVADAADVTLSYNGQTKTFPGALLSRVGEFMTTENITEAVLTFNKDLTAEEFITPLVVPEGKKLTVELNGKNLTSTIGSSWSDSGVGFRLGGAGADLTIQGTGTVNTASSVVAMATNASASAENHAKVMLKGGTLKSTGNTAITGASNMDITVDGASIEAVEDNNAFYGGGNIHVISGTIKNNTSALFEEFDKLTVDNCNATTGGYVLFNGSNPVVINGGEFHAVGAIADYASDFTINGGKFYTPTAEMEQAFFTYGAELKVKTGNTLVYNTANQCWELKAAAPVVTGNMVLTYGDKAQAFDGTDLGAVGTFMKDNAITEATLKLYKDIPEFGTTLTLMDTWNLTIDLNGHKLATETQANIASETGRVGAKLTLTDTSSGAKGSYSTKNAVAIQVGAPNSKPWLKPAGTWGALTINNGVTVTGKIDVLSGNLTMTDAKINGSVKVTAKGTFTETIDAKITNCVIDAGTMASNLTAVYVGDGKLYVKNSTVNVSQAILFSNRKVALTIDGGTYITGGKKVVNSAGNMTVLGGTFKCASTDLAEAFQGAIISNPDNFVMQYNKDQSYWEMAELVAVDTGSLKVTPTGGLTAEMTKVEDAFAAVATSGGTIQLTGPSSLSNNRGIVIQSDIVLDLNGNTLTLAPFINGPAAGAINIAQGGSLTIKDSTVNGELDLNGAVYGITLSGTDADFTLEGGTIDAVKSVNPISRDYWAGSYEKDYTGKFLMTGGKILADAGTAIYLSDGTVGTNATAVISGGEIICTGVASGIRGRNVDLDIKGTAKIQTANGVAVTVEGNENFPTKATIAGNAVISTNNSEFYTLSIGDASATVSGNAQISYSGTAAAVNVGEGSTFTVEGTPKLFSTGSSVIYGTSYSTNYAVVNLNGGLFKMGADTLFIEYPKNADYGDPIKEINYKADDTYTGEDANLKFYILSSEADAEGYHGLVKRQDVKLTNAMGQPVGYQNYEDLQSALKSAENLLANEGTGNNAYTGDTKQAVTDTQVLIAYYLSKPSTSQYEIDLLTARMNKAIANLKTVGTIDPNQLADGVYTVNVNALKSGKNDASMSAGALEPTATLIIKDGKMELRVGYQPIYLMGLYGHLVRLWAYDGNSAAESLQFARSNESDQHLIRCEATEYYTVNNQAPLVKVPHTFDPSVDYDAEGVYDAIHFPGELVIPVKYVSSAKGEDRYVCRVSVDAMNGLASPGQTNEQDLDIQVMWGTAKKVEQNALLVNTNSVNLAAGASQTITASFAGAALPITWKSGNDKVATVDVNGKITAVAAGTTRIAVTASDMADNSYLRVITVTVTEAAKPAEYAVTVENGTGSGNYAEDATVTIKANAPAAGKVFDKWVGEGVTFADAAKAETTFVMPAKAVKVTATYKDEVKPQPSDNQIDVTMKHEYKDQNSMCDKFFEQKASVKDNGDGTVTLTLKVAYPIPAYPDQGVNGTVTNTYITYNGTRYDVASDITTKPLMTVKETNSAFGLVKGDKIPAQVLTVTLPKEAVKEGAELVTNTYVNVVMNTDVIFRMVLSNVGGTSVKYAVTVENGAGTGSYVEGATVNIKANAPAAGKVFDKWVGEGVTFADATKAETTFVMPAKAVKVTATYKDEVKPDTGLTDGKYTAPATMLHEYKDQPSMCDPLFDATVKVEIIGENAVIKLMLANPIPGFPDQGADGSVKNVVMTYAGKTYNAVSDLSHKVQMTAKADNDLFKLKKGEKYDAQILTFTVPKAALTEATLKVDAYVNVVMMTDVVFRLKLGELVEEGTTKEYTGTAKVNQFGKYDVNVVVTVKDNKITNVAVTGSGFGGTYADVNKAKLDKITKAVASIWNGMSITDAEGIFKAIHKNNNSNEVIDTVSGATMSAKTARDAVMNALKLTFVDEVINVPETVEPGIYEVEIGYYSDVVWHSLVENAKAKATLTVNKDGTMSLSFDTKSGTRKEPLYILGFNGVYPNNDRTQKLTMDGCKTVMGLSSNDYEDKFFAKGTQVVNHVEFPLLGGLTKEYATNCRLYVPAMNNLNGVESGVLFENGKFDVDIFAKIYWDSMKKIGEVPGTDPKPEIPVEKEGTITLTMKKEGKQENSMSNVMFAEKGDVLLNKDGTVTLKIYVAYPVPAYPALGTDGTVKNVAITFNGKTYKAVSDITTKPLMTVKETNTAFGLVKGDKIPAQILTFTLPKEALDAKFLDVSAYVNVVMDTNVDFDMYLSNLVWGEAKPDPEIPEVNHPAVDLVDEATGLKVHAGKNVFLEEVKLVVDPIVKGEKGYDTASKILEKLGKKYVIFDVHMENAAGQEVQPNGTVIVSYRIPSGCKAENMELYRINGDGSKTRINGAAKDGYFVVPQRSFSVYGLVDTTKETPVEPTVPETTVPETTVPETTVPETTAPATPKPETPQTGDSMNLFIMASAVLISAAAMAVLVLGKKKRSTK